MENTPPPNKPSLTRRDFIKLGALAGGVGLVAAGRPLLAANGATGHHAAPHQQDTPHAGMGHGDSSGAVGDTDLSQFNPSDFMYAFDWGKETAMPDGGVLREWDVVGIEKEIEIAPGVFFPAWTFNGTVPGTTFRCREGDRLRFHFTNGTTHPHTIHFHGFHPPAMDGLEPMVQPGETFTYEFTARPFGVHPYHCHVMSLKKHIHKGLYGTLIIDPPQGRPPAREMVMVMNAFDTNFDNENEVYAVNTVGFHYANHPIQVKTGEPLRIYLTNMTEFDLINSFHLHGNVFKLFRTGTSLTSYEITDNVILGQGERAVIEFTYKYPGRYMFHAHQSEFSELGWAGFFEVQG